MRAPAPDFDRVARPYRILEYLTMGRVLERTRFSFLPETKQARRALVLGDGDGRFVSRLLHQNPAIHVTAVDLSAAMLRLLRTRCAEYGDRLETVQCDALSFCRTDKRRYDLIATHFFLDCLSQAEVDELTALTSRNTEAGAQWIVSEFRIPHGAMQLPAKTLVRGLYAAFRILTGLTVTQLPDHAAALEASGFVRLEYRRRLSGILSAERWERRADRATRQNYSHN
ncbi:MAG: class I SAM-dependent methyltransferase [Edaphobacter sp.]|uniref:class I SAM-dependent methyltransferase n=1 Tax=Edaphobacter sp. TaxID=1934404 RepID=UPI002386720E|nr:class I SAM-dependent methyltransferase [Edaphobacter sp.]MDE1176196.1 class I SAM-dependent methyltransferase [Edaphobacter sp.]